jgi:curli biogenesis system outer membrane secretion channel CsgG
MKMQSRFQLWQLAIGFALAVTCLAAPAALAKEPKRADLFEDAEEAEKLVVRLTAPSTEGAGIIFQADAQYAYGITAKHVVFRQGKAVEGLKALFQPWPQDLPVTVYKLHFEEDLAVFQVDLRPLGLSLPEIQRAIPLNLLGSSENLDPGNKLWSVGHSTAGAWITPKEPFRFSRGDSKTFLFESPCPQGHSGGGVFDESWQLVGMMIEEERPFCRALRIEPIMKIVQGWKLEIGLRPAPKRERDPTQSAEITVAVVDFDNRSGRELPNIGALAQDITTTALYTVPGARLVTRDRLDSVQREHGLPTTFKSNDQIKAAGRLLKADALVTGSIMRSEVERRTFEGFGTNALQDISRMAISLQILDVDTGSVRFSKTFDIERTKQYPKATSAPGTPIDLTSELLTALLDQAQKDMRSALLQVAAGRGRATQFVQVPVTTNPAGADVILKGAYIGSTPTTLQLTLDEHDIAIEMQGYESWHRRVKVQPGLRIDVSLLAKRP